MSTAAFTCWACRSRKTCKAAAGGGRTGAALPYRALHGRIVADGLTPARVPVAMLAVDGALLANLPGILPFDTAETQAILAEIAVLTLKD